MRIRELLEQKGRPIHTIGQECSVAEAVVRLMDNKTGALIVMKADQPVGIFTERDLLRCHGRRDGRGVDAVRVEEAMTNKLIVAEPEEDIETAMATMIQADIRHLPVIAERRIVGMLTLGDLVKQQLGDLKAELHYLHDYISNLHDASRD